MENVAVRFKKHHDVYNSGEVAGFPADVAEKLIVQGVAELRDKAAPRDLEEILEAGATAQEKADAEAAGDAGEAGTAEVGADEAAEPEAGSQEPEAPRRRRK